MVRITPFGLRLIVSVNENENKGALLMNMVLQKYHLPNMSQSIPLNPIQPIDLQSFVVNKRYAFIQHVTKQFRLSYGTISAKA